MLRPARKGDAARIDAFLEPMTETSLFLRGNLARHGLFERAHPHGTRYFVWEEGGDIRAVFGCTNGGYLMCQAPDPPDEIWAAFAQALDGVTICGMTGIAHQVEKTLDALELPDDAFSLNHLEPLYQLDLSGLAEPRGAQIRRADASDVDLLRDWFRGYVQDTEPYRDAGDVAKQAEANAERAVTTNDTRLLIEDDEPRAMTAINARAGGTVQVGGVYVPPECRGRGLGGRVVAAHLADLRSTGDVQSAVLFAFDGRAAKTYERIGFRQIGTVRIARLRQPIEVGL